MATRMWLAGALLTMALPAGAGNTLAMQVSSAFSFGPSTLTIQLSTEPDAANRTLTVVVDSGEFYRSSEIALDGEHAARTNVVKYRGVPAGEYDVQSALIGTDGQTLASVTKSVMVMSTGGQ